MKTQRNECLRLNKAVDLLHRPGTRMMIMHAGDGDHFYVVPGGRVNRDDAHEILKRPDIIEFDDGLFPGNPQSWKISR
jgi:MOSC domain-containing protein YiiM